jgi:tagatose 6-phosphate kinase
LSRTILCIGATPAAQRVMVFHRLNVDAVNRATITEDGAAGKAVNVAKVLKLLGEHPVAIGFLGGDRGAGMRAMLQEKGIEAEFIEVPAPTRECVTVIDEGAGTHTELVEESRPVGAAFYETLLQAVRRRVKPCAAMVMSGTLTPGAPADFYFRCAAAAKEAKVLTIIDAHGPPLTAALEASPDVVKPNRAELAAMAGDELKTEEEVMGAMRGLSKRGARQVVVTGGKEPALAYDGQDFWKISPPRIRAVNPTGSGDAFTAGLTCGLTQGDSFAEACRLGAACGAANALTLMPGDLNPHGLSQLAQDVRIQRVA